jgi:2-polyprenyl-6-methoxyphenol hydroxylase-like FAD-dependent oxidoreductase
MTPHAEVLIIGAGPSGLFAAAELARHGVPTRLVERDLMPHREARATAIQPGTLETWQRLVFWSRCSPRPNESAAFARIPRTCPRSRR